MLVDNIIGLNSRNIDCDDGHTFICPTVFIRPYDYVHDYDKNIIIKYYVSDYYNKEYIETDYSHIFTTIIDFGNGKKYSKTTHAGEQSIIIPALNETGVKFFSMYTIDEYGVLSFTQFFKILLVDDSYYIKPYEVYTMVESDLTTYGITTGETATVAQAKANKGAFTSLFSAKKAAGYKKIILLNRTYMLDYHNNEASEGVAEVKNIEFPSNFTVDLNGATFKMMACTDLNSGKGICIKNCVNTHVINGKIFGNADVFDAATTQTNTAYNIPGEALSVIDIINSSFCSFENIDTEYNVGYNLDIGGTGGTTTGGCLSFTDNKYIDRLGNEQSTTEDIASTGYIDISSILSLDRLIQIARYLGYSGYEGNNPVIYVHFYDEDNAFIKTVKSRQYFSILVPENAKYIRVTASGTTTNLALLTAHNMNKSYNCTIKNVTFSNTRTCVFHPTVCNNIIFDSCKFDKICNLIQDYAVTTMIADFEDGWLNCQNIFIENCVANSSSNTVIAACTGFNFNFKNNTSIFIQIYDGCYGMFIDKNTGSLKYILIDNPFKQNFNIIYDNVFDCVYAYNLTMADQTKLKICTTSYNALLTQVQPSGSTGTITITQDKCYEY